MANEELTAAERNSVSEGIILLKSAVLDGESDEFPNPSIGDNEMGKALGVKIGAAFGEICPCPLLLLLNLRIWKSNKKQRSYF
jgi:hypothetical protein